MCVCAYMICILGTGATELHEHQPPLPTVRKALEHRQKLEQIKDFDTSFKRGYVLFPGLMILYRPYTFTQFLHK